MPYESIVHVIDADHSFLAALELTLRASSLNVHSYTLASNLLDSPHLDRPGCVITELRIPDMDGLELQQRLRQQCTVPVIFVSGQSEISKVIAAFKGGAVDFLEKPLSERMLLSAVHEALAKDAEVRRLAADRAIVNQRYCRLSPREQLIFHLIVSDLSNKEIARQLQISPRTVEHHRQHVMFKMRAGSLAELITMAVLCGIRKLGL
jgi:two-component system response regulator FixJ